MAITAVYGGVAVVLGVVAGSPLPVGIAVVLTVLTTLVFAPVRRRLEGFADRWVFGPRPTPPEMLAGLDEVLETAPDSRKSGASRKCLSNFASGVALNELGTP